MSTEPRGEIHGALLRTRESVGAVKKEKYNERFKYNYRGIEEVLNAVGPALLEEGVNVRPELVHYEFRDVTTGANNTRMREVTVKVVYHYEAQDGSEYVVTVPGEGYDTASSATAKAMSAALRTAHLQALQIPVALDEAAETTSRSVSDQMKLINDIIVAAKLAKIVEGNDMAPLYAHFEKYTGGVKAADAPVELLKEYLDTIRPKTVVSRKPSGGRG
jgi:ERF superfamily.